MPKQQITSLGKRQRCKYCGGLFVIAMGPSGVWCYEDGPAIREARRRLADGRMVRRSSEMEHHQRRCDEVAGRWERAIRNDDNTRNQQ